MLKSVIFVLSLLAVLNAVFAEPFSWSLCPDFAADPNRHVSVETVDVTPSPVVLPGDMQITVVGNITKQVNSADLSLSIKRKTFLLNVPIPCIMSAGSCTYDLCSSISLMISSDSFGITAGLGNQLKAMLETQNINPMNCPIGPVAANIVNYRLSLPAVPGIISWFSDGDYTAQITSHDKETGETLLCINVDVSVASKSTGGFLFG